MRPPLQTIAAAWCVLMVVLLGVIQLATPGAGMPPTLWLLFSAVWVFGAAMLWWSPTFGAIGTAVYGAILGYQVLNMHGAGASSFLIAVGSFLAAALAVGVLVQRRASRG